MQFRRRLAAVAAAVVAFAGMSVPSAPASAVSPTTGTTQAAVQAAPTAPSAVDEVGIPGKQFGTPPRVKDVRGAKASSKKGSTFPKGSAGTPRKQAITKSTFNRQGPPNTLSKSALVDPVYYNYASGYQYVEAEGASANFTIHKTFRKPDDYHTLVEMAVQSDDGRQKVEIGIVNSQNINGDDEPHLFGYHWVDDVGACWNGCGWQDDPTAAFNLGDAIPSSMWGTGIANIKFAIRFYSGVWWLGFNGEWVGYFPGSLWSSKGVTFEKAGLIQVFGEAATRTQKPCTDLGDGVIATNTNAAQINSFSLTNPTPSTTAPSLTNEVVPAANNPDKYATQKMTINGVVSNRSFRYGGPGWDSVGWGVGATDSCAPATAGTTTAGFMHFWREICPDNQSTTGCNLAGTPLSGNITRNICTAAGTTGPTNGWKNTTGTRWKFYKTTGCTDTPIEAAPNSQGKFPAGWASGSGNGVVLRVVRTSATT